MKVTLEQPLTQVILGQQKNLLKFEKNKVWVKMKATPLRHLMY